MTAVQIGRPAEDARTARTSRPPIGPPVSVPPKLPTHLTIRRCDLWSPAGILASNPSLSWRLAGTGPSGWKKPEAFLRPPYVANANAGVQSNNFSIRAADPCE
jgi:hypothetical protein